MPKFYAVCNVNGPISIELNGETKDAALAAFAELDTRSAIDNARTDAEDALDISGDGMSEGAFDAALVSAGAECVQSLSDVSGRDGRAYHVVGDWALWSVE